MVGENMNNLYKPSNKFSPVGLPLMFLAMLAAGVAVSWLYLVIASVIPLIYLNILMAVGISMLLGFIGAKFVRIFKIRAPIIALVITAVALIFVNYAKWAIYVGRDWNKNFYDDMKDTKVSELLTEEDLPANQEEAEQMAESLPLFKNYTFSSLASISSEAASWISTVEKLFGDSLYDMYAGLLGTTADEILESSEKLRSSNMSLYEYMYEYRGMKERTTGFLLIHPGELFSDIKDITATAPDLTQMQSLSTDLCSGSYGWASCLFLLSPHWLWYTAKQRSRLSNRRTNGRSKKNLCRNSVSRTAQALPE